MRTQNRKNNETRKIEITPHYLANAMGSCLISFGRTKVVCSAYLEDKVPPFLINTGTGWITSEYSMLPGSTVDRTPRESSKGKTGGRTHEIQRLIGRSLRAVSDLRAIGEKTIWVDCDVIDADGGTRTAAITGGFIALYDLVKNIFPNPEKIIKSYVAAVSVGIVSGELMIDLDYEEDFKADVDMNVVMLEGEQLIEVQGTAEHHSYSKEDLNKMLSLAQAGIEQLFNYQKEAIKLIVKG